MSAHYFLRVSEYSRGGKLNQISADAEAAVGFSLVSAEFELSSSLVEAQFEFSLISVVRG